MQQSPLYGVNIFVKTTEVHVIQEVSWRLSNDYLPLRYSDMNAVARFLHEENEKITKRRVRTLLNKNHAFCPLQALQSHGSKAKQKVNSYPLYLDSTQ